nr:MAG TPA: hypothetical protein [Bacteriophage sp.]
MQNCIIKIRHESVKQSLICRKNDTCKSVEKMRADLSVEFMFENSRSSKKP